MSASVRSVDFERDVVCIMGLPFDVLGSRGAVERVQQSAVDRRGCFVSTANLNFVMAARDDERFRDSVIHSDLCVADGMPIVWVARLLGLPVRERVAGANLFEMLDASPRRPRLRVFFFGGPDGAAEKACRRINERQGGVECVGFFQPGFGDIDSMSDAATLECINNANPDFVIVSLGAKKGQAWIDRNRQLLNAPVISHLGAVVNFAAGSVDRAPGLWQRLGFEWLWRVKEEPALWRRYAKDGVAFLQMLATSVLPLWWRSLLTVPRSTAPTVQVSTHETGTTLTLSGRCTGAHRAVLKEAFRQVAGTPGAVTIDLTKVSEIDAWGMGLLLLLHGHQRDNLASLTLIGASAALRRQFRYHGTSFLLNRSDSHVVPTSSSRFA